MHIQPTFVLTLSFKDKELGANWGSEGFIDLDGVNFNPTGNDYAFSRLPINDHQSDEGYRGWNFNINQTISKITLRVTYITSASQVFIDDIVITGQGSSATVPIPEPATLILFGTGLAGMALRKRRKV